MQRWQSPETPSICRSAECAETALQAIDSNVKKPSIRNGVAPRDLNGRNPPIRIHASRLSEILKSACPLRL
jgi:hypothetical protein